jgi:hypothetical protein
MSASSELPLITNAGTTEKIATAHFGDEQKASANSQTAQSARSENPA